MLSPPRNVSFMSENLLHVLMWEAGANAPFNARYTVEYLSFSTQSQWLAMQNCSLISNRTCDLTDEFSDINESYWARVKTVTEMDESNWTFLEEFQPHRDTKIRPVNVRLAEAPVGVLKINFDSAAPPPPISRSIEVDSLIDIYATLKYHLAIFKSGKHEKDRDVLGLTEEESVEVIVENVQPNTNYCVTIKMFFYEEQHDDPLEIRCIVTHYTMDDKALQALLIFALCLLGVSLFIIIVVLYKGGCLGFLNKYGPQALNNLKHISAVYNYGDVQEKFSTTEHVIFSEMKTQDIEEDSEEELMNSDEGGYEHNSLPVLVQNSAQSSSAFSKVGIDGASTMSCGDRLCDSVPEDFFTDLDNCQMAPANIMQNECSYTETKSQIQTIHSRRSSLASANINIFDVPLCSVQIQDSDCSFVNFSNEQMCDKEVCEPDIDDLGNSLISEVCDDTVIYHSEKSSLCDVPGCSSFPQTLYSDYMRR
ncbi:interferon alpha/beta receptor 2-like isoform X2 [Heptranchias perlo]